MFKELLFDAKYEHFYDYIMTHQLFHSEVDEENLEYDNLLPIVFFPLNKLFFHAGCAHFEPNSAGIKFFDGVGFFIEGRKSCRKRVHKNVRLYVKYVSLIHSALAVSGWHNQLFSFFSISLTVEVERRIGFIVVLIGLYRFICCLKQLDSIKGGSSRKEEKKREDTL
ncbi:hypothetical protein ACJX0J_038256, partial [Zea mays]